MKGQTLSVAVIGNGYWGKNLVRNFHELGVLACVSDLREESRREAEQKYAVRTCAGVDEVLADQAIRAVAIAAPAVRHYEIAKRAMLVGKDVYVEKPLALRLSEARELVELAQRQQRILMVGHILQYHPAILKLRELIRSGEIGRIRYIYSSRLNLGKLRTEENILWSFAPHDISAILYLLGEMPNRVTATGGHYLDSQIYDTTLTTCEFQSGVKAHIFVSWLHPFKEQKLTIVGGRKMAVFDDLEAERKLVLYSHKIEWVDRLPVARREEGQVVALPREEPLKNECAHFLHCLSTRETPRTDGRNGLEVLQVLDACERSLGERGRAVEPATVAKDYFAHPTAVIDEGCDIGAGTRIWHFSHIMPGARLGTNCNLGQNVVISPGVKIGNNVKIQNNVSVYTGVELEDNVFCGPSMVFTNVINPRSHIERKHEYRRTLVREGASIGANATVVCGVTLGRYSFVAAGAVVTRDVPDYGLVMGVPAEQVGWMCYCGARLPQGPEIVCEACSRRYLVCDGTCQPQGELLSMETPAPIRIAA